MNKTAAFFLIFILFGCNKVNTKIYLDNPNQLMNKIALLQKAKAALIKNRSNIDTMYLSKSDIEKHIRTKNLKDLDAVLKLWDENLLWDTDQKVIKLHSDSLIDFDLYRKNSNWLNNLISSPSTVFYFVSYDLEENWISRGVTDDAQIIKTVDLGNNWKYVEYWSIDY
jgi:hypothetical protein